MANPRRLLQLASALLLLSPVFAHADWSPSGNNVTQVVAKRFDHFPHLAPDSQGGVFAAWETEHDTGFYDKDVAVCRVSFEGDVLWSTIVSSQAGYQRGTEIVDDGVGGAIVVWFDERTTAPGMGIYAQHYNDAGVAQWATDGIRIADSEPILGAPFLRIRVVSDGASGAFVAWNAYGVAFNGDVFAQLVLSDGSLPWGANGLGVTASQLEYEYSCDIAADGSGGLLVTWVKSATWPELVAQHFDANGARLWSNNGALVCNEMGDRYSPRITSTTAGGAIIVWDEESTPTTEIYAQRLDGTGTRQWALPGESISTLGVYATENSASLISDGSNGAFVIWSDNRNDVAATDLFAVHLLGTGATGSQNPLTAPNSRAVDAGIVSDGAGGSFVTWRLHDTIGGPILDLVYVQWLDAAAANLLTNGGVLLYDVSSSQMTPDAVLASPGRFVVMWEDYRDQPFLTDCYARLVEGNTTEGTNVPVSPVDLTTGTTPATLTFDNVTSQGATSLTTGPVGPPVPGTFLSTGIYYHLTTNATFSGSVEVCIVYDPLLLTGPETDVTLIHFDGTMWVDITSSVDTLANVVCGTTTSLSPFAVGVGDIPDGVGDGTSPQFTLHQNIPNPFNPQTTIRYDVPTGGAAVNISVYDITGRLVRELVDERRAAGTWLVQWNGDDDGGARVASGVYFYRLRAGSFVETKKMVLLK